jgi:hypothetical protein
LKLSKQHSYLHTFTHFTFPLAPRSNLHALGPLRDSQ